MTRYQFWIRLILVGYLMLGWAIVINLWAQFVGWYTWHRLLSEIASAEFVASQVSVLSWIFLLLLYPFTFGVGIKILSKFLSLKK